jgi:hypothetical protein
MSDRFSETLRIADRLKGIASARSPGPMASTMEDQLEYTAGEELEILVAELCRVEDCQEGLLTALKMIRHNWAGHSEACESVLKRGDGKCDCDWPTVAAQCDAAIAKATAA